MVSIVPPVISLYVSFKVSGRRIPQLSHAQSRGDLAFPLLGTKKKKTSNQGHSPCERDVFLNRNVVDPLKDGFQL